ncbi:MAG TPA: putative toxin-antitoxin system toxin component, PIN family [Thermoanaerobaculia bacterium]|nr:putative toxin-antitoxin system toxin component, PIN family [Thermoanaerobaculia bacterium]
MLKIVIDTNIWIRCLLGGRMTLPLLDAWRAGRFQVVASEPLLAELAEVWQRPRLRKHIAEQDARDLLDQLRWSGSLVELTTAPPECRDPKDGPFLATAIAGDADAIVSGDGDLRADDQLRSEMAAHGVEILGVEAFLARLDQS